MEQGTIRHSLWNPTSVLTKCARLRDCNKSLTVTIILFFTFVILWGTIVLGKFYSLHSYVFDLGFVMQRLWQVYTIQSATFAANVFFSAGFQFVLSPLYFFHSFQLLLIFQVVAFGITVFPLYGIATELTQNNRFAMLISAAFLFYFPSAGILWFDVHFQAFFVPLFVFAYYFYLKGNYLLSLVFFILSGTVRFPYMVFPFMFAFLEIIQYLMHKNTSPFRVVKFNIIILVISAIFIVFGFYFSLIPGNSPILYSATPWGQRIALEFWTFLIILAPLLFFPILSPRWLAMTTPFFLLGIYTGSANYVFPALMSEQYTSMVLPMVFLGTIEAFAKRRKYGSESTTENRQFKHFARQLNRLRLGPQNEKTLFAIAILVVMLSASMFYAPYGPGNQYVQPSYSFSQNVGFNLTNYNALMRIESLIPKNNPYVLFENDMPQFLPRPPPPNTSLPFLFSTYISASLTLQEVTNNSFPLIFGNPHVMEHTKVDYLVANTKSNQFGVQFNSKESTLPQIMSLMMKSGKYGILAEDKGFIALERDYHSPPRVFVPMEIRSSYCTTNPIGGTTFVNLNETPQGSSSLFSFGLRMDYFALLPACTD